MTSAGVDDIGSVSDVLHRAARALLSEHRPDPHHRFGDHAMNPELTPSVTGVALRDAAVLVPIVNRGRDATLLLTQRTDHLATHAGQVAFPGGKVDDGETAAEAALREAEEEVGLNPATVEPLGFLPPYTTGTGFRVVPYVGFIAREPALTLNENEVADAFEVPLAFLMNPDNHLRHSRVWNGKPRAFYAMPYGDRYIWGATAGIIRGLFEALYGGRAEAD